jgi:ribosomal protein L11 methyltransferase
MLTYRFFVRNASSTDEAWEELHSLGAVPLYSEEFEDRKEIVADLQHIAFADFPFTALQTIGAFAPVQLDPIDWTAQWALHGLDYQDGYVHLHVPSETHPVLKLEPGPGFGDLSHPTTRLVVDLMESHIAQQWVLDIGTGSGVLALAAKAMGAQAVWGFDIDPQAVEHAQKNLQLNGMEAEIHLSVKPPIQELIKKNHLCILMNMIVSEQLIAWKDIVPLHHIPGHAIVSGILAEERDSYLQQASLWGWQLLEEKESEGWLGFYFLRNPPV